jgi:3'-phosphoadenosine 5'-phosphosulfate sulfotransferase (PAPS reductase)/FAD synthetase
VKIQAQLLLGDWASPPVVDLTDYDVILINTSAGKDSQTMLREIFQRATQAGVTDRLVAVHCDLGRIEWSGTRNLAQAQAAHYGIPFAVVRRTGGDLLDYVAKGGKWPSSTARYCTSDFKRGPVRTLMTTLADAFHGGPHAGKGKASAARPCRILNCMGHRADESPARAKAASFRLDHQNRRRIVYTWLPIHTWTLDEVWADIRSAPVPHHRAYDLGMPRLSCVLCIFAPRDALILAGHHNPALLADYVAVENRIGHTFRQDQTLVEIQSAIAAGELPRPANIAWPQCA